MPNLIRLYFILIIKRADWQFLGELLDGYVCTIVFYIVYDRKRPFTTPYTVVYGRRNARPGYRN
jgi:hypothetical protein